MSRSTRRAWLAAIGAVGLGLMAGSPAAADIAPYRPAPRALSMHLSGVELRSGDAPSADAQAVVRDVGAALRREGRRLSMCLRGVDLREDPNRQRRRSLTGTLTFERSRRPRVQLDAGRGIPPAARQCVSEVVRSVSARSAPRGTVVVALRYVVS